MDPSLGRMVVCSDRDATFDPDAGLSGNCRHCAPNGMDLGTDIADALLEKSEEMRRIHYAGDDCSRRTVCRSDAAVVCAHFNERG